MHPKGFRKFDTSVFSSRSNVTIQVRKSSRRCIAPQQVENIFLRLKVAYFLQLHHTARQSQSALQIIPNACVLHSRAEVTNCGGAHDHLSDVCRPVSFMWSLLLVTIEA